MNSSNKNILIVMGSFKDVFSPKESYGIIKEILQDNNDFNITSISIADGGEFSHEVVKDNFRTQEVIIQNIVTPYKTIVDSSYLIIDNDTAFISSSKILRIDVALDEYKNPLYLTSFGLGQLINDALQNKRIKEIIVGLGGTNTVDAGIGMLQALGFEFLDSSNNILKPNDGKYFSGIDIKDIKDIKDINQFEDINITALCDGIIGINSMHIPTNQKISQKYILEREDINHTLKKGIDNYTKVVSNYIKKDINIKDDYYGVAGAINLSIKCLCDSKMMLGINYFIEKLDIIEKIKVSDLVITGEGKFDNSLNGKTPVGITNIAKEYNKDVLYLVGSVSEELEKYFDGNIAYKLSEELHQNGISTMISCHNFNKNYKDNMDIVKDINIYKENTKIVFKESIKEYLTNKGYI